MEEEFLVNTGKSKLRLRDAPEDGKILTQLPHGRRVIVLDRSRGDGWWQVKVQGQWFSASEGWVASGYLTPVEPVTDAVPDVNLEAAIYRLCAGHGKNGRGANPAVVNSVTPYLRAELAKHDLMSPLKLAHFLAQTAVESNYYQSLTELYNPPKEKYFQKYDPGTAPGRKLGNTEPGDGLRFRGRGVIQLTGRDNYTRCDAALNAGILDNPDLAATPELAARTAVWFWTSNNIQDLCVGGSPDDVKRVSSAVNRGWRPGTPMLEPKHLSERRQKFALALQIVNEAIVYGNAPTAPPPAAPAREPQGAPGHSGPASEGPVSDAPMNSGPASEAPTPTPAPDLAPVEEPAPAPAPEPVAAEPSPAPEPIVVAPPMPEEPRASAEDAASVTPIPPPEQPPAQPSAQPPA